MRPEYYAKEMSIEEISEKYKEISEIREAAKKDAENRLRAALNDLYQLGYEVNIDGWVLDDSSVIDIQ